MPSTASTAALLTIDADAVVANWRRLAAMAPADACASVASNAACASVVSNAACAAVVKADAYGLGMAEIAPRLAAAGCRDFIVALPDEALALRPLLPAAARLYVLGGLFDSDDIAALYARHDIRPVLNHLGEIARWTALGARLGRKPPAAIHIDTGMNRLGLGPGELATLQAEPDRLDGIDIALWISHLACSEEAEAAMNAEQLDRFTAALARLPSAPASLANSSGIFRGPGFHFQLLRPGAALYGINPTPGQANPMRDVVRLTAPVLQVREVEAGMTVGYNATRRFAQKTRVATLALGYADGYYRSASNRGMVYIAGRPAPVVGRVSMDLITVDIGDLPVDAVKPGDRADIIGPHNPVDAVAAQAGTIGYEILTSLGARYHRRYAPLDSRNSQ